MTLDEITTLGRLAAELRANGVLKFSATDPATNEVLMLELAPPQPAELMLEAPQLDTKCKCGHASYEHNAGLCILGCDPTKCAPEKL